MCKFYSGAEADPEVMRLHIEPRLALNDDGSFSALLCGGFSPPRFRVTQGAYIKENPLLLSKDSPFRENRWTQCLDRRAA